MVARSLLIKASVSGFGAASSSAVLPAESAHTVVITEREVTVPTSNGWGGFDGKAGFVCHSRRAKSRARRKFSTILAANTYAASRLPHCDRGLRG
jgi:hypothetical protein